MIHCFSFQNCLAFRAHAQVNPPEGQTNPLWLLQFSSSGPPPLPTEYRDTGFVIPLSYMGWFRGCLKVFMCRKPNRASLYTWAPNRGFYPWGRNDGGRRMLGLHPSPQRLPRAGTFVKVAQLVYLGAFIVIPRRSWGPAPLSLFMYLCLDFLALFQNTAQILPPFSEPHLTGHIPASFQVPQGPFQGSLHPYCRDLYMPPRGDKNPLGRDLCLLHSFPSIFP